MALYFNSVEPTQIIAKNSGSAQTIAFPTGTKIVTGFQQTIDGKKQAIATFTSTHNFPANMVVCCDVNGKNNKTLTSINQLISEQTQVSTTYSFYAKFSNNTLSLEQVVVYSFTGASPQSVPLRGRDYSATFYNATDLTVLKDGTTTVWGKPFSLTIQAGANSTVAVNRTSSPNQHANTGAVTSGGIVYYGDTLTITATPASGYKLTKFTINGTEYASGQTSAVSQTITVTSAVSIVSTTESAASWRTYWTGSLTYGFDTIHTEEYTTTNYFPSSFFKQTPFRITGSYYVGNNAYGGGKPTRGTFADKELPYNTGTYANSYAKVELVEIGTSQYQIKITCHTGGYLNSYVSGGLSQITITKLDIYD